MVSYWNEAHLSNTTVLVTINTCLSFVTVDLECFNFKSCDLNLRLFIAHELSCNYSLYIRPKEILSGFIYQYLSDLTTCEAKLEASYHCYLDISL